MSEERELLEKLYLSAKKLDQAFINKIYGIDSGLDGEQYDEINDVFIEVAEYLGIE